MKGWFGKGKKKHQTERGPQNDLEHALAAQIGRLTSTNILQEIVRFNMTVQILGMEGLPRKYKQFRVMLQRGRKSITSGDLFVDVEHNMATDNEGAATMQFVSSMQRASTGFEFDEKDYRIYLLRVNERSTASKLKKVGASHLNLAQACTRNDLHLKLVLDSANQDNGLTWISLVINASTRPHDDSRSLLNSDTTSIADSEYSRDTSMSCRSVDTDDSDLDNASLLGANEDALADDQSGGARRSVDGRMTSGHGGAAAGVVGVAEQREDRRVALAERWHDRGSARGEKQEEEQRQTGSFSAAQAEAASAAPPQVPQRRDKERDKVRRVSVGGHGEQEAQEGRGRVRAGALRGEVASEGGGRGEEEGGEWGGVGDAGSRQSGRDGVERMASASAVKAGDGRSRTQAQRKEELARVANLQREQRFAAIKMKQLQRASAEVEEEVGALRRRKQDLRARVRHAEKQADLITDGILQLENAGELLDTTLTSSRGRQCTGKAAQDAWIKALRDQVQAWKAYASKAQDGKLGAGNVGEEGGVEGRVGKGEGRSGGDLNRVAELEMMLAQQRKENARMEERVSNLIAETAAVKDEITQTRRAKAVALARSSPNSKGDFAAPQPKAPPPQSPSNASTSRSKPTQSSPHHLGTSGQAAGMVETEEELERVTALLIDKQVAHANAEFETMEVRQQMHKLQENNAKLEKKIAEMQSRGSA